MISVIEDDIEEDSLVIKVLQEAYAEGLNEVERFEIPPKIFKDVKEAINKYEIKNENIVESEGKVSE